MRARITFLLALVSPGAEPFLCASDQPRVIVTTDGEIDDECSMVRLFLHANYAPVAIVVGPLNRTVRPEETVPTSPFVKTTSSLKPPTTVSRR